MERRTWTKDDLVALLAATLGRDKSSEVVTAAIGGLGVTPESVLTAEEASRVLESLGRGSGLVAIAARLARVRGRFPSSRPRVDERAQPAIEDSSANVALPPRTMSGQLRVAPRTRSGAISEDHLVGLLSSTLGSEKASSLVRAASGGQVKSELSMEEAVRILDRLAATEGIVGTAASFAKVRLLLRAPRPGR